MKQLPWFERNLKFGLPAVMLPYYLERLNGTFVRIQDKIKDIPDAVLSNRLDNKWSVKQNIGHLAEVDKIANKRIDEMIAGQELLSPAVFEPQDYNPWPVERVLEFFHQTRSENIRKYRSLSESDLKKSSVHPRLKVPMTPVDLAWFDAEHDDHHMVRMHLIIQTLTA